MGQGVRTGIPMILADELEADWSRVKIWQAPGDETKYDPAGKDGQNTDGSRSTRHHFEIMRELGASARNLLERAAAEEWGVNANEVYTKHHRLYHTSSGRSFDFGELVDAAANLSLPTGENAPAPRLKHPSEWKYIGRDLPVVDNFDMSTGGATYGADVSLPGMKIAVIARSPVYRGKVRSFDATEALQVSGVEQVIDFLEFAVHAFFQQRDVVAPVGFENIHGPIGAIGRINAGLQVTFGQVPVVIEQIDGIVGGTHDFDFHLPE